MSESLLNPSSIKLYGKPLADLVLKVGSGRNNPYGPGLGDNKLLQRQLEAKDAKLARIYGFSFEGVFVEMSRPAVLLVHGDGKPARPTSGRQRTGDVDESGLAAQGFEFADDMQIWAYDKGDFTLRLDVTSGPLEEVLLEAEVRADQLRSQAAGFDFRRSQTAGFDFRMRRDRGGSSD